MGHTITVRRIPQKRWTIADAVGYFDPQKMEISICSAVGESSQEHIFWHEATHAIFYVLNSPHYEDEQLVDQIGGLLHQITHSAVY